MSKIYTDLNTVLTPYATAIKKNASDIDELNGSLDDIDNAMGWETVGTATSENEFIYPYHSAQTVKIQTDENASLSIHGITVADLDHNIVNPTYHYIEEVESEVGHTYRITEISPNDRDNDYSLSGKIGGLTPGKYYRLCMKITDPQNVASGGGHSCAIMVNTRTVPSIGTPVSDELVFVAPQLLKATNTSHDFYIYPFRGAGGFFGYTHQVGDTFRIDDFYLNEVNGDVDLYTHEKIFQNSGQGKKLTTTVNSGMFVASADKTAEILISKAAGRILTINGNAPDITGDMTIKSHLQGKNCICFGDSITIKGINDLLDYPRKCKDITGLNCINAATGGTSMRYREVSSGWNVISFAHIAEMIASGNFSEVQALGNQSGFEAKDRCKDLYLILSGIEWSNVDYITIAYGANDFSASTVVNHLENTSDLYDKYTYLGAFRYALKTILEVYPHIQFMVLTPVFRWWRVNDQLITSDERVFDDINGQIYYYYWGDKLKECAENEMRVPVVDMYRALSINKYNAEYFSTDGVHPDYPILPKMGSVLAGAMMAKF